MASNRRIRITPSDSVSISETLKGILDELSVEDSQQAGELYKEWPLTDATTADSSKIWDYFQVCDSKGRVRKGKKNLEHNFQRLHGSARLLGMDVWITLAEFGSSMRHELVSLLIDRLEREADRAEGIDLEADSRAALKRAIEAFCDEIRSVLKTLGRSEAGAELQPDVPTYEALASEAASTDWAASLVPVAYLWNPSAERLERVYEHALRRPGLQDGQRDGLLGINAFPSRFLSVHAHGDSEQVIDVRPGAMVTVGSVAHGQAVRQAVADEFESDTFAETEGIKRTLAVRIRWRDDQEVILFLNFRHDPMDGKLLDLLKVSLAPAIDQLVGWLQRHGVRIHGEPESLFEDGRRNIMQEVLGALKETGDRHSLSGKLKTGADQAFSQAKRGISPTIAVHLVLPVATTESVQSQAGVRGGSHYFGGFPPVLRPGLCWIDPESKKVCCSDDDDKILTDGETVPDEWAQPGEDGLKYMVEFQRGSHELNPKDKKNTRMKDECSPLKSLAIDKAGLVETGLSVQAARWIAPIFYRSLAAKKSKSSEKRESPADLSEVCRYSDKDDVPPTDWELAVPIRQLPPIGLGSADKLAPIGVIDVECPSINDGRDDLDTATILRVDAVARLYSSFDALRRYRRGRDDEHWKAIWAVCLSLLQPNSQTLTRDLVLASIGKRLTGMSDGARSSPFPNYVAFVNPLRPSQSVIECFDGDVSDASTSSLKDSCIAAELIQGLWKDVLPITEADSVSKVDFVEPEPLNGGNSRRVMKQRVEFLQGRTGIPEAHGIQNVYCAVVASHLEPLPCGVALMGWKDRSSPEKGELDRLYLPAFSAIAAIAAIHELKL